MGLFQKKTPTTISIEEYQDILKQVSNLKIEIENLKLTFDLVKKKLRQKAKLDEPEEENNSNSTERVLLSPEAKPLNNTHS